MIKVTLKRGLAGKPKYQKLALISLGLKKPGQHVILEENSLVYGNIEKVKHLVCVEEMQ